MMKIRFTRRFDHQLPGATKALYAPGDVGEFEDGLANALAYEGFGAPHCPEEDAIEEAIEKSEGDAPANKMKKSAPLNKSKG